MNILISKIGIIAKIPPIIPVFTENNSNVPQIIAPGIDRITIYPIIGIILFSCFIQYCVFVIFQVFNRIKCNMVAENRIKKTDSRMLI